MDLLQLNDLQEFFRRRVLMKEFLEMLPALTLWDWLGGLVVAIACIAGTIVAILVLK